MKNHRINGSAPALSLNLLSNFQRVETVGHNELAVIRRAYNRRSYRKWLGPWRSYQNGSRREIETMVPDKPRRVSGINVEHLGIFATAVQSCGASLQSLALRDGQELFGLPGGVSLRTLRHLELNIDSYERYQPSEDRPGWILPTWVRHLDALEDLTILTETPTGSCSSNDVLRFFLHVKWPRLRNVYLKNVETRCGTLIKFLDPHRKSLQYLGIVGLAMSADDWAEFCKAQTVEEWRARGKKLELMDPNVVSTEPW